MTSIKSYKHYAWTSRITGRSSPQATARRDGEAKRIEVRLKTWPPALHVDKPRSMGGMMFSALEHHQRNDIEDIP